MGLYWLADIILNMYFVFKKLQLKVLVMVPDFTKPAALRVQKITDVGCQETVLLEKPDSDQERNQTAPKKYIRTELQCIFHLLKVNIGWFL